MVSAEPVRAGALKEQTVVEGCFWSAQGEIPLFPLLPRPLLPSSTSGIHPEVSWQGSLSDTCASTTLSAGEEHRREGETGSRGTNGDQQHHTVVKGLSFSGGCGGVNRITVESDNEY